MSANLRLGLDGGRALSPRGLGPGARCGREPQAVFGIRAVALALFAQALAIGIQIYAVFREVGKSERLVTIVVLVVASAQIILTRPREERHAAPAEAAQTGWSEQHGVVRSSTTPSSRKGP